MLFIEKTSVCANSGYQAILLRRPRILATPTESLGTRLIPLPLKMPSTITFRRLPYAIRIFNGSEIYSKFHVQ